MNKDDIYLEMAQCVAKLSKDDIGTRVGCIILTEDGRPVSWGYRGNLAGIDDSIVPHSREEEIVTLEIKSLKDGSDMMETSSMKVPMNKYPFIYSAESNAIFFAKTKHQLAGATIYQTYVPDVNSAKEIVRVKIKRIVCPATALSSNSIGSTIGQDFDQVLAILATGNVSIKIGQKEYFPKIISRSED